MASDKKKGMLKVSNSSLKIKKLKNNNSFNK